jgi:hypothetical protein
MYPNYNPMTGSPVPGRILRKSGLLSKPIGNMLLIALTTVANNLCCNSLAVSYVEVLRLR